MNFVYQVLDDHDLPLVYGIVYDVEDKFEALPHESR